MTRENGGRNIANKNELIIDYKSLLHRLPGADAFLLRNIAETREWKMTGKNKHPGIGDIG